MDGNDKYRNLSQLSHRVKTNKLHLRNAFHNQNHFLQKQGIFLLQRNISGIGDDSYFHSLLQLIYPQHNLLMHRLNNLISNLEYNISQHVQQINRLVNSSFQRPHLLGVLVFFDLLRECILS